MKKGLFKTPRLQKKGKDAVDAGELREVGLEQIRGDTRGGQGE